MVARILSSCVLNKQENVACISIRKIFISLQSPQTFCGGHEANIQLGRITNQPIY
jgi:hypothetical protein